MAIDKNARNGGHVDMQKSRFDPYPVSPHSSGEGLPYAPEDWPCPGDKWRWRVGKRTTSSGYFLDRYLYPPERLQSRSTGTIFFKSKLSLQEYVRECHGSDVKAFFDSFSWKIPSTYPFGMKEHSVSGSQPATSGCKAGNKLCSSLQAEEPPLATSACDICCSEPGFCRGCSCILCSTPVESAFDCYTFIRCEASTEEGVCGHLAHLNCGLKCFMAGTVGASICLDVEYYCRRCDTKTDLLPHLKKLLKTCEAISSLDDIIKILNMGSRVMHGSQRSDAKRLLHIYKVAMGKQHDQTCTTPAKTRTALDDVRNVDDISTGTEAGVIPHVGDCAIESTRGKENVDVIQGSGKKVCEIFDAAVESLRLEYEVDDTLRALRKSQQLEYDIVKKKVDQQKNRIVELYQQLDKEKSEIARHMEYVADPDALLKILDDRRDQIKKEELKLKDMESVTKKGFGKTSKESLKQLFGLE